MKKVLFILLFSFVSLFAFEELTANNFEAKTSKGNVIVDFHAIWWGSCKILGKNLQKYKDTNKAEDVKIYKLNVGDYPNVSKKYKVAGVPALVYFKDGKIVDKKMGIQSADKLKALEIKNFTME